MGTFHEAWRVFRDENATSRCFCFVLMLASY
jgi:hypothetical protein